MLMYFTIILFIIFYHNKFGKESLKLSVLKSVLLFSVLIVIITEFLSIFKILTPFFIISFWLFLTVVLIYCLVKNKTATKCKVYQLLHFFKAIKSYSLLEKTIIFLIFIGFLVLFFQGLLYPPNNWDSLTYHLSRIMYWLSNESVAHFPTHILRHMYQPPFAEYFIMHLNVVQGNDYFANSIQLFFLLMCLNAIWLILDVFNINRLYKFFALLFVLCIPSVVLQATTTKNDIVSSFFILSAIYFLILCYKKDTLNNYVFLGLSIGLGIMTKGTTYIFLAPPILIFGLLKLIQWYKNQNLKNIKYVVPLIAIILTLNLSHFSRNYKANNHPINIDEAEAKMYSNEEMSLKLLALGILKNAGLHIDYPFQNYYDQKIRELHTYFNVDIDSPKTNYKSWKYSGAIKKMTHEDLVPNGMHFSAIFISTLLIIAFGFINFTQKKYKLIYILMIGLQIVLFVGYLKWQPWHNRLHIPLFILATLLIVMVHKKSKSFTIVLSILGIMLVYNFWFLVVYNNLRPFKTDLSYTKNICLDDERDKKYFSNQLHLWDDYLLIIHQIKDTDQIGFLLSDWEYPFLTYNYHKPLKIQAINVGNITNKLKQVHLSIDIIITDKINEEFIMHNNVKYKNESKKNKYVWVYRK